MRHFRFSLIFIVAMQATNIMGMKYILNSLGLGKTQFNDKALALRRLFGEEKFETKLTQQNIQETEKKDKSYVGGRWDLNICNIDAKLKNLERELKIETSQKRLHYYFDEETEKEIEEDDWELVKGPEKFEILENYFLGSIIIVNDPVEKKNANIIDNYMIGQNTEKKDKNPSLKPKINPTMLNTIIGYENRQKNLGEENKIKPFLVNIKQEKIDEEFSTQEYGQEIMASENTIVFEVSKNSPQAKLIPLLMILIQNNQTLLGKDCFVYEPPEDFEIFPDENFPYGLNDIAKTQYYIPPQLTAPDQTQDEKLHKIQYRSQQTQSKTKKKRRRGRKPRKKYTIHVQGFNQNLMSQK